MSPARSAWAVAPPGCPRGYDEQGVPSGAPMSRTLPLGRTGPPRDLGRRVARGGGQRAAPPRLPRRNGRPALPSPGMACLLRTGNVLGLRGVGLRRCRRVAGAEQLDGLRRDATLAAAVRGRRRAAWTLLRARALRDSRATRVEPRGWESRALRGSSPPRCGPWALAWTLRDAKALRWSRVKRSLRAAWAVTLRWAQQTWGWG
eukprot:scaffold85989_cov64-Phaeocystis_antarctica.AAC.4